MRKLATILMLISALLVGGIALEAKTTKKTKSTAGHSSSKSSLNFKNILNIYDNLNYNTSLSSFQTGLNKAVAKFGFKPDMEYESIYESETPDGEKWQEDAMHYCYAKGETSLDFTVIYVYQSYKHIPEITLTFPSSSSATSFINSSKSALGRNFKQSSWDKNVYLYFNWTIVKDGNEIELLWHDEM